MKPRTFLQGKSWNFHFVMGCCIFGSTACATVIAAVAYNSHSIILMDSKWMELGIIFSAGMLGPIVGVSIGCFLCWFFRL